MANLISNELLSRLPLQSQPVAEWGEDNDLVRFLVALFGLEGAKLSPNVSEPAVDYSDYGGTVYTRAKAQIEAQIATFEKCADDAKPISDSEEEIPEPAKYLEDPDFGRAAKHLIAWEGVVDQLLSETAFYSLAHLLESSSDLDCSMELMGRLYYKQALQVVRNFVEDIVLPVHFSANPGTFAQWKQDACRIPPMRRKGDGMLPTLVKSNVIPKELADAVGELYDALNGSVHGRETRLIHAGIYSGTHRGMCFSRQAMRLWADYVTKSIVCGLRFLRINLDQLDAFRATGGVRCDVCHGVDSLEVVEENSLGGEKTVAYQCSRCGNEMRLRVST